MQHGDEDSTKSVLDNAQFSILDISEKIQNPRVFNYIRVFFLREKT